MDNKSKFSPYRVTVVGRSVSELKQNIVDFLAELNGEEIIEKDPKQLELSMNAALPGISTAAGSINIQTDKGPMHIPALPVTPVESDIGGVFEFGVDSKGLPWDSRIHAVSSGKNKDGSWRYRRGVEETLVTQVEQELIAKIKASGQEVAAAPLPPAPVAFTPPAPVAPVPQQVQQPVIASPLQSAPNQANVQSHGLVAAPGPVAFNSPTPPPIVPPLQPSAPLAFTPPVVVQPPPVNTPVASAHTLETFKEQLVPILGQLTESGKINQEYVAAVKRHFGIEQIWQVNDTQLAEMFKTFCDAGFLTRVG